MKNIYHSDIYNFEKPVNSYWEDTTKENFNLRNPATSELINEKPHNAVKFGSDKQEGSQDL